MDAKTQRQFAATFHGLQRVGRAFLRRPVSRGDDSDFGRAPGVGPLR
jgi:hypothetical protein